MKKTKKSFLSTAGLFLAGISALIWHTQLLADAEITRSGNTWYASVDGTNVYTGSRFFDATNTAIDNMSSGTVHIRNSGDSGPDGGNVYAIRPKAGMTLDFHGHIVNANGGDLIVPVYCDRRDNITVQNLVVTGNPRYGVWFRGCSNAVFENITMNLSNNSPVGLGMRIDSSTATASNLTIRGSINIDGSAGHAIETYGIEGFSIGDVNVTNSGGCGLLLNDSRNGTVGNVVGHHNNLGGGYATFRVANNNGPNVSVNSVYSRDSGRGFFSVTNSNGTTINSVDIANTTAQGIFLEDASNTHVISGSVSNGNPNCQLVRTSSSSLNVSGCDQVGTSPSGGPISNGTYQITAVHSGKVLDSTSCLNNSGTNVQQWSWLNNDCQKWIVTNVDGQYYRISPAHASNLSLDIDSFSTEDGANVMLWNYIGGVNQQYRFQSSGSGRWRIINRNSEKCLDVFNLSADDGANITQWECISGNLNQQFSLTSQ